MALAKSFGVARGWAIGTAVAAGPPLAALTIGAATLTSAMAPGAIVAAIAGKTAGSALSMTGIAFTSGKLAVAGSNIVVGVAGPLAAADTTGAFSLIETKTGAPNSPRTSGPFGAITVADAAPAYVPALDFSDPRNSMYL